MQENNDYGILLTMEEIEITDFDGLPIYIIQTFGDLPRNENQPSLTACTSLEEALDLLSTWFPGWEHEDDEVTATDDVLDESWVDLYPDPEDDRIVIWEATPGTTVKAVWHFSGWHWDPDANDLPGGPLEQGKLPGDTRSMFEIACTE